MKTLLEKLWECKYIILITWFLLFLMSIIAETQYSFFIAFLICGGFAIGITLVVISYFVYIFRDKNNHSIK
jgi:hypothetical protein